MTTKLQGPEHYPLPAPEEGEVDALLDEIHGHFSSGKRFFQVAYLSTRCKSRDVWEAVVARCLGKGWDASLNGQMVRIERPVDMTNRLPRVAD